MSEAMENKMKKSQLNWVMAGWFPYADEISLQQLTSFVGWEFLVDDEIDQVSKPGVENEEAFDKLINGTLSFVEHSLGLSTESVVESPITAIKSFETIALAMRERFSVGLPPDLRFTATHSIKC